VNLIRDLESYLYEKDVHGRNYSERPLKNDNHAVYALRYAFMVTGDFGGTTELLIAKL